MAKLGARLNMSFNSLSTKLHLQCFGHPEVADMLSVCRASKRYKKIALGLLYMDMRIKSWLASQAYTLLQGVEARTNVNKYIKNIQIRNYQSATPQQLMLVKVQADLSSGLHPYPSLRYLEVTAEAGYLQVPLLADLERLVVHNAEEDLGFDCTALRGMCNTQLDELGTLCDNITLRLYELASSVSSKSFR
ncbi:hypothetical protein PtrEW4_011505 [Pyrenophora tritici-repentis]|nr:hypothetical protein PtrEW4_011505 [Pyrenophora tritici-repentis]KAI1563621.1 hypothetical protein PtrEW7m1_010513 [Pyrenophora tritici-repentis]